MTTARRATAARDDPASSVTMAGSAAACLVDLRTATSTTTAAAMRAAPVTANTVQRPNTARKPPIAGPPMKPACWAPDIHA